MIRKTENVVEGEGEEANRPQSMYLPLCLGLRGNDILWASFHGFPAKVADFCCFFSFSVFETDDPFMQRNRKYDIENRIMKRKF